MAEKKIKIASHGSTEPEKTSRETLLNALRESPIPDNEMLENLGLFQRRQEMARLLFMHDLYRKMLPVHGIVAEFGTRWGQNLVWYSVFRSLYEPYNYNRKVVGFDTFGGFVKTDAKDTALAKTSNYSVTKGYESILKEILQAHEDNAPLSHIKKSEVIKGDASKTLPAYLKENPQTIVALAYFDFDVYEPTKKCLEALKPHLTKGSIVAFDQLNCDIFKRETEAVREVFGLDTYAIRRDPLNPLCSYLVIE